MSTSYIDDYFRARLDVMGVRSDVADPFEYWKGRTGAEPDADPWDFIRVDANGQRCGNSYIPAGKQCRVGKGTPVEGAQGGSVKKAKMRSPASEKELLSRFEDIDDDPEDPRNPVNMGVDPFAEKYSVGGDESLRRFEADVDKRKQKLIDSRPKGYFDKGWRPEDEYAAKNLLGLDEEDTQKLRDATKRRRQSSRAGKIAEGVAGLAGLAILASLPIAGMAALKESKARRERREEAAKRQEGGQS